MILRPFFLSDKRLMYLSYFVGGNYQPSSGFLQQLILGPSGLAEKLLASFDERLQITFEI